MRGCTKQIFENQNWDSKKWFQILKRYHLKTSIFWSYWIMVQDWWVDITRYLYHSETRLYLYISMHINLQLTYQEIFIYIVLQKGRNQLVFDWFLCAKACGSNTNPLLYKHEIVKLHDKVIYWKLPLHQILIFHQFLIIGLPFPQALIRYKTSCSSKGFLKVNIANTKKYEREPLIYTATYIIMEWY